MARAEGMYSVLRERLPIQMSKNQNCQKRAERKGARGGRVQVNQNATLSSDCATGTISLAQVSTKLGSDARWESLLLQRLP